MQQHFSCACNFRGAVARLIQFRIEMAGDTHNDLDAIIASLLSKSHILSGATRVEDLNPDFIKQLGKNVNAPLNL